jgi:hypothetical protein
MNGLREREEERKLSEKEIYSPHHMVSRGGACPAPPDPPSAPQSGGQAPQTPLRKLELHLVGYRQLRRRGRPPPPLRTTVRKFLIPPL